MWIAVVLALIAVAAAQQPRPCAGPASFTGRFRRSDRERQFFVEGRIFYDGINQRIREFEFEEIGRDREIYDRLKLYNLNTEYSLNLRNRTCTVETPRPRQFIPFGVPPNAQFRGEGTLGVVGDPFDSVTVAYFDGFFGQDFFFVSVTQPDCFPVEFGLFSNETGFEHREFFDLVAGVTDPEAFIPPRECTRP